MGGVGGSLERASFAVHARRAARLRSHAKFAAHARRAARLCPLVPPRSAQGNQAAQTRGLQSAQPSSPARCAAAWLRNARAAALQRLPETSRDFQGPGEAGGPGHRKVSGAGGLSNIPPTARFEVARSEPGDGRDPLRVLGNPWSATEPSTPYFIGASAKLLADSEFPEDFCSPLGSMLGARRGSRAEEREKSPDPSGARVWACSAARVPVRARGGKQLIG